MAPNVQSSSRPGPSPHARKVHLLHSPLFWTLAIRLPALFPGPVLHRAALHAASAGAYRPADALFERAAGHYRMDLEVEALACLRVHQLMARVRAGAGPRFDAELRRDVEQRLSRLEEIETLDPPFARVPAFRMRADGIPDPAPAGREPDVAAGGSGLREAA